MGDLSALQNQAQQMMKNMGINPEQLVQQAEAMGLNKSQVNRMNSTMRSESTRQRLLKKLQEKQQKPE
jgi:hypothetical protein